jgi:hypothetical protein
MGEKKPDFSIETAALSQGSKCRYSQQNPVRRTEGRTPAVRSDSTLSIGTEAALSPSRPPTAHEPNYSSSLQLLAFFYEVKNGRLD